MSKLKPCPFCGSADVDRHGWYDGEGHRGPECMGCGATGASEEVWNRREAPPIGTRYRDESGEVVAVVVPVDPQEQMLDATRALMMPDFSKTFDKARRHVSSYHGKDALASWPEWAMEGDEHIPKNARSELAYRMMLAALPEPE